MNNKFNTDYNHVSDKLCAIRALGIYRTRWNNFFHDLHPNRQKLYGVLSFGDGRVRDVTLRCEYTSNSALIQVEEQDLRNYVLLAIRTAYPQAEQVGEQLFIRVVF